MFYGAGTQGVTLFSQHGPGAETLQSSFTFLTLPVYPFLGRYKKANECSQISHSPLILLLVRM